MQFLDKFGWPVERFKGRKVINLIRLILHTRKIKCGKFKSPEWKSPDGACVESGPLPTDSSKES